MDPVTHGLLGLNIGKLFPERRGMLMVIIIASVLPDIDYLAWIGGADTFMRFHRGITHGFLALFVVPGILSFAFLKLDQKKRKSKKNQPGLLLYYGVGFAGYLAHIVLDFLSPYGVRLLSPLDGRMFSLDLVLVLDPVITGVLLLFSSWIYFSKKVPPGRLTTVAIASLAVLVLYTGVRYYYHESAEDFVKSKQQEYRVHRIVPQPGDIMGWWFVASGHGEIKTGYADLLTDHVSVYRTYPAQGLDETIEATRKLNVVGTFLRFSRSPYAEKIQTQEGTTVIWRDLAFSYLPGERFAARVKIDPKGVVISKKVLF
jgi:inner membrane protein